jgi:hypothetical protein
MWESRVERWVRFDVVQRGGEYCRRTEVQKYSRFDVAEEREDEERERRRRRRRGKALRERGWERRLAGKGEGL